MMVVVMVLATISPLFFSSEENDEDYLEPEEVDPETGRYH
tara:strand:- start:2103 stop:2222 length:120 start_codon:yes stop_codon:yes gene_type:complete